MRFRRIQVSLYLVVASENKKKTRIYDTRPKCQRKGTQGTFVKQWPNLITKVCLLSHRERSLCKLQGNCTNTNLTVNKSLLSHSGSTAVTRHTRRFLARRSFVSYYFPTFLLWCFSSPSWWLCIPFHSTFFSLDFSSQTNAPFLFVPLESRTQGLCLPPKAEITQTIW
jgi:hypothetical protein